MMFQIAMIVLISKYIYIFILLISSLEWFDVDVINNVAQTMQTFVFLRIIVCTNCLVLCVILLHIRLLQWLYFVQMILQSLLIKWILSIKHEIELINAYFTLLLLEYYNYCNHKHWQQNLTLSFQRIISQCIEMSMLVVDRTSK